MDGDAVRLAQILSNLLTNAAKYMPPDGVIRLTAERDGDRLTVAVADEGAGLPGSPPRSPARGGSPRPIPAGS